MLVGCVCVCGGCAGGCVVARAWAVRSRFGLLICALRRGRPSSGWSSVLCVCFVCLCLLLLCVVRLALVGA